MALFIFTEKILSEEHIDVYNFGKMKRDFTYIEDIIEGLIRLIDYIPQENENWNGLSPGTGYSFAPYRLYNIGNNTPVELMSVIKILEENLGKKAKINFLPIQKGDVPETYANTDDLMKAVGYKPHTKIEDGMKKFIEWYKAYQHIMM